MSEQPRRRGVRTARTDALNASPPIFGSPALDRLTRVHPAVPAAVFGPAIAVLAILAFDFQPTTSALLGLLGGYAAWTLCEYWIHRVLFHFEPQEGLGARLHWMIHGVHHDHPSDPMRLVLPPAVSLPFAVLFLFAFMGLFGEAKGLAVTAGFYAGYLVYDMVHFALHHARPSNRVGRRLHELHMRHHFEDDQRGFGVSAPWWDIVFGTYSPRARRSRRDRGETPPSQSSA
jgi:sterol desaturase/sphingolipid hydroxylase (fatty acid hydroxylase superfamily)